MSRHHIITQVAGHAIDVVKLLPPFVIGEPDVRWFLEAFEEVMVGMHKFPGPAWDVITDIGKAALTNRAR
jgi:ornithine--oxo-acid transaminase